VGRVDLPQVPGADQIIGILFEFGPTGKEGAVIPLEVESWARALGVEFDPWMTRLFIRLSREYCGEQHRASKRDAEPPWPEALKMWRWVQNQKAEKSWDREEKRAERQAQRAAKQKG